MKSGSGFSATGSGGSTIVCSVPSSIRPSITPAETPASRAASLFPRTMPSARSASTRARARGHALRRLPGKFYAGALALGAEVLAHAQAHAQHHAARRHRVVRHPVDEAAQLRTERRVFELFLDVLEPVVEPDIGFRIVRPYHRRGVAARAERHRHDIARRQIEILGHPVRIGAVERDRHQHIDDTSGHATILRRFSAV